MGLSAGLVETNVPFNFGGAVPFSWSLKYWSLVGVVRLSLMFFHNASWGLSAANFAWLAAAIWFLSTMVKPAGGFGLAAATVRSSLRPASSAP